MNPHDLISILIYLIISIFGTAARQLRSSDIKEIKTSRLISDMIVSSFGALIVYFIVSMTSIQSQLGYILAGFIGWGGPELIDMLLAKNTGYNIKKEEK